MLGLRLKTLFTVYSSPSLAFCAAMAWAACETPGTVWDWRKEIREEFVVTAVALLLLMIGLFGGIGGGTRAALAAPNWPFLTGGWGGWLADCTLWALIIVATFVPTVMAFELSCLKTWPGDIDLAIPVAENKIKTVRNSSLELEKLTWSTDWLAWNCRRRLNNFCHAAHAWAQCRLLKRVVFHSKTTYFKFEIFDSEKKKYLKLEKVWAVLTLSFNF